MMANGSVKELTDTKKDSVSNYSLIGVDEGSMINSILLEHLESKLALADTKVIIIGDREQLPPVGEQSSPIWSKYAVSYELTEVMRHQSAILTFVQGIRGNPNPSFVSPGPDVVIEDDTSFMEQVAISAARGDFHDGTAKAIAWRNVTVDYMNNYIRSHYEPTKSEDAFVPGDRIVFREPIFDGDIPLASTDQEGLLKAVSTTQHNKYPTLKCWKLHILCDDGSTVVTHVLHAESRDLYTMMCEQFAAAKRWFLFWKLKEAFSDLTHSYALTAHRSQGSQWPTVFVEAGDLFLNKNISERTKCLYVACSRAGKKLHVYP
jgi:exodeoxyribonuclease-5